MLQQVREHLEIFCCPACGGSVEIVHSSIRCLKCSNTYSCEANIPLLFHPNTWDSEKLDVTEMIRSFYEKYPFPNYEGCEDPSSLVRKAEKNPFIHLLNEQIPFNIRVLEVGCGTGQMSNFLGIAHRTVFGTDICLNSLKLAENFRRDNGLERVGFYQMNLFRPIFREGTFPLVICSGVLHHTSDPFLVFQTIAKLVKKGGYILVGLYNRYGRWATDLRRLLFRMLGDRGRFMDPRLRGSNLGEWRKTVWFQDQYKNPHESKHTMGEVLRWFNVTGFEFVNSIPAASAFATFTGTERLFQRHSPGTILDRFLVQTRFLLTGSKEGGLFIMIARNKD